MIRKVVYLLLLFGCRTQAPSIPDELDASVENDSGNATCVNRNGATCLGDVWLTCSNGVEATREDCAARGQVCAYDRGCVQCVPGSVRCVGEGLERCNQAGDAWRQETTCNAQAGQRCSEDGCLDLCARAAETRDYVGCEYWPVTTRNNELDRSFSFALAIGNPQLVPAIVRVHRGNTMVAETTVAAGAIATITLPWVEELAFGPPSSRTLTHGAYRVVADVPVTVHQFSPLNYVQNGACQDPERTDRGRCFSFTNDASLLVPTAALTGSYVVQSRPTHWLKQTRGEEIRIGSLPGFVTIVATQDETVVTLRLTAKTNASADNSIVEHLPGETLQRTLMRGEVLQVLSRTPTSCPDGAPTAMDTVSGARFDYCDLGRSYDLTGTEVLANKPVAVYSGHDCAFIPFNRWACDHLEEQLLPVETWGREIVAVPPPSLRGEPTLLRLLSVNADNMVSFSRASESPRTLGRGEFVEIEIREPLLVRGSAPLSAVMFMVGQNYAGISAAPPYAAGDPAMTLVVPREQWRTRYAFLLPSSYESSHAIVAVPNGFDVVQDRQQTFLATRSTSGVDVRYGTQRLAAGVHRLESGIPFSLSLYGLGSYTSYWVPGGMSLTPINEPLM